MSEAKKQSVRIIGNYARLLCTLALGIAVVPLTLRWLGDASFGIITLMGANIGMAAIFRQIIQNSLVRELGSAYHSDEETFRRSYGSICSIAIVCALLSIVTFGIVFALIPLFELPENFTGPARWFVFGQGIYTVAMVILAPMLSMYLVKENFIGYNIWFIGVRASNIISVLILGYVFVIDDPALGLTLHGITWGCLAAIGMLIASWIMIAKDSRLKFSTKGGDKEARKQVLSTFSWNTGVQIAINLHEQIPQLLLNLFYGTIANAAWGIGYRFVAYIRMCTTGVQFGSDAVSARMASGDDAEGSRKQLQRLITVQTKLTAMIAIPASIVVFVYVWPIFDIWVGTSLEDYNTVMPIAVYMSRIMAFAIVARSISESWMFILYGAGFIKVYAPWIILGGIIAPITSIILMNTLPQHLIIYAPPSMFAFVFVVIHLFGLPIIAGKCLKIRGSALLIALIRPLLAGIIALVCSIGLLYAGGRVSDLGFTGLIDVSRGELIDWKWMLASLFTFGFVYTVNSAVFVLDTNDRQRLIGAVRSRIGKRS